MKKIAGAISISALLMGSIAVIGSLVSVLYANLVKTDDALAQRLSADEIQKQATLEQVTELRTDVSWIKDAMKDNGIRPLKEVVR